MTAHLDQLAALAASLPPGAVLAHVVTRNASMVPWPSRVNQRAWAKIGDEPWRSVTNVTIGPAENADCGLLEWCDPDFHPDHVGRLYIILPSVVWEQGYGLRGRHEVMGVVG